MVSPPCLCSVSVSISNLYPGCENVSVRSRSMMFEPSLTKGVLEVFSPVHSALSAADEQATKAIDIQHANIHGESREDPRGGRSRLNLCVKFKQSLLGSLSVGVGDFSVWEFSGNPVYYCTYDYFAANDVTAIHVVLFSLEEPYETQLGHITYWLNLLKALTLPQESICKQTNHLLPSCGRWMVDFFLKTSICLRLGADLQTGSRSCNDRESAGLKVFVS